MTHCSLASRLAASAIVAHQHGDLRLRRRGQPGGAAGQRDDDVLHGRRERADGQRAHSVLYDAGATHRGERGRHISYLASDGISSVSEALDGSGQGKLPLPRMRRNPGVDIAASGEYI
jgi:hypothetical protein